MMIVLSSCASSESAPKDPATGENLEKLKARALGVSTLQLVKTNAISIKLKFDCQDESYKVRMFKYKIRVTENDKEIQTEGLQKSWVEKNVTIVNLRYPKTRDIKFKSIEISAHSWVRSFPDSQLGQPLRLTLQECKDLAPY
jgi:hypothetical protein